MYDDSYAVYWVSDKDALHSANIRIRTDVAIVIFGTIPGGPFDGVYLDAVATELSDESDIQAGIDLFKARRPQPDRFQTNSVRDVTGSAAWRMYKATPIQISKRSDAIKDGQAVTIREVITL